MVFWSFFTPFKKMDWLLLAITMLLILFGLVALYSVSLSLGESSFLNFKKQIIFSLVGLCLLLIAAFLDYKFFKIFSWPLYALSVLLLIAVLFFGQTIRGTTGWFSLGWFNIQPVEIAKLALIVFLARYFSNRSNKIYEVKHILLTGLATGLLIFLIMLQPDLGSALTLLVIWLVMLLILGIKRSYFLTIILIICLLMVAAWFLVLHDYQKDRILTFLNPSADPLETGYNVQQSIIAIGSGQFWGQGLSFGSQSQLKFLPESQTDFIFAVIAEELGLIGVAVMLILLTVLFYRLAKGAGQARDDFGSLVIMGVIILLASQSFVNIATNLGLVPVTGISLPLVSYGGSSLLIFMVMIGLVESIIIRRIRRS
ncbi:MAG: rod shape-determining protein RodA [bacterium]